MLNIRAQITTVTGWKRPMSLLEAFERKETLMANKQVINMVAFFLERRPIQPLDYFYHQ